MSVENYQSVLSAKTQAILEIDRQQKALLSQEARKTELISAISQLSQQIDDVDSDELSIKNLIESQKRELAQIEASLTREAKAVYAIAEKILKDRVEIGRKFNQAVSDARSLWAQLTAELPESETIAYRSAFAEWHPVANLGEFDPGNHFRSLPTVIKHEGQNSLYVAEQGHLSAL